jgi:GAF domain-containing protein
MVGMQRWVNIKDREQGRWEGFVEAMYQLLDDAIVADSADRGNVQLFNPLINGLQIINYCGFDLDFLQHFTVVRVDDPSACGRAFRYRKRVMIQDIAKDRAYAPFESIARSSGYRAVQSTPVLRSDGSVIGVVSTHLSDKHTWSELAQVSLDGYAVRIGDLISALIESRPLRLV